MLILVVGRSLEQDIKTIKITETIQRVKNKYIWHQVKLLLWVFIKPGKGALNTHRASDPGIQPNLHSLTNGRQLGVIVISEGRIFQRAGAMTEKACLLLPPANVPWMIEPAAILSCLTRMGFGVFSVYTTQYIFGENPTLQT